MRNNREKIANCKCKRNSATGFVGLLTVLVLLFGLLGSAVPAAAQTELADIREKISQEAKTAKAALKTKVDEFADDICQKILGRTV